MKDGTYVFGLGDAPDKQEGSPTTEQPSSVTNDTAKYNTDDMEEPIDTYVIMLFCPWHLPGNDR